MEGEREKKRVGAVYAARLQQGYKSRDQKHQSKDDRQAELRSRQRAANNPRT